MRKKIIWEKILYLYMPLIFLLSFPAVYSVTENQCLSIDDKNKRNLCFIEYAAETENSEICSELGSYAGNCFYKVAIKISDISLCDKAESFKGECYYELAIKDNSSILCESAKNKKESCYFEIALKNYNSSLCEKSGDKSNDCYFTIAKATNNVELCYLSEYKKDDCISEVALVNINPDLCEQSESKLNDCYYNIAKKTNNPSLCEQSGNRLNDCYYDIAKATNNPDLCFLSGDRKEDCLCDKDEYLKNDKCIPLKCDKGEAIVNHRCEELGCVIQYYDEKLEKMVSRQCGSLTINEFFFSTIGTLIIVIVLAFLFGMFSITKKYTTLQSKFNEDKFLIGLIKYVFLWLSIGFFITTFLIPILIVGDGTPPRLNYYESEYFAFIIFEIIAASFAFGFISYFSNYFIKRKELKYSINGGLVGLTVHIVISIITRYIFYLEYLGFIIFYVPFYVISKLITCGGGHPDACSLLTIYIAPVLNTIIGIILGYFTSKLFKIGNVFELLTNIPNTIKKVTYQIFVTVFTIIFFIHMYVNQHINNKIFGSIFAIILAPLEKLTFAKFEQSFFIGSLILLFYLIILYVLFKIVSYLSKRFMINLKKKK